MPKDFKNEKGESVDQESFEPRFIGSDASSEKRAMLKSVMPKGKSLAVSERRTAHYSYNSPSSANSSGGGMPGTGNTLFHAQRPYIPQMASPDRQQMPVDRAQWNTYMRMFHRLDPMFGTAVDMYSEMSGGDYDLVFDDQSNEIRDRLNYMCEEINLLDAYRNIVSQYMVLGEAIPHLFFNDETGLWSYITLHNPDHIDVKDTSFIHSDPIVSFVPDEELRSMLSENTPEAMELRQRLPAEFVQKILARQTIRLSPLNCTFLARKMSPYDLRGTSIGTRLWRIWMVEDAVYDATIATFRRAAAPVKVLKMGDSQTATIPSPEREKKLIELLKQAELDPQGWIAWDYMVNYEQWGNTERSISIGREHDTIEKVKLSALGLSKSFMSGEISYACFLKDSKVLAHDMSQVEMIDIRKGDVVIDRFGNKKKVIDKMRYPAPDEMVEITLYGGKTLTLTENHRLPVFARPKKCMCGCGEDLGDRKRVSQGLVNWRSFSPLHHLKCDRAGRDRTWAEYKHGDHVVVKFPDYHNPYQEVEAKDIRLGDWLMIPRKFEESDTPATKENLEKARLLGYYVAEGSITDVTQHLGTNSMRLSFGIEDKKVQYAVDARDIISGLGHVAKIEINDGKHTVRTPVSTSALASWCKENASQYSEFKCLSEEVMHWNLGLKEELVKGMYRGDGYLLKTENSKLDVVYTTISTQLASQVELILAQLGYSSYTTISPARTDKKGYKHKPVYMVTSTGRQAIPLAGLIWGNVPAICKKYDFDTFKKDKLGTQGEHHCVIKDDDYLYLPIKKIRRIKTDKEEHPFVYNITVEGTHSYVVSNIASFNSAKSGLQVFLRRLLALRQFIERAWIYPKVFRPLAVINEWYKAKPSEIAHQYRVKKTAQEIAEEGRLIIPKMKWKNKLETSVDQDVLQAFTQLEKFGVKISKSTVCSAVGLDYNEELEKSMVEFSEEGTKIKKTLGDTKAEEFMGGGAEQAKPPGGAGSGAQPPGAGGKPPGGAGKVPGGESAPPGSGNAAGDKGPLDESIQSPGSDGMPSGVE